MTMALDGNGSTALDLPVVPPAPKAGAGLLRRPSPMTRHRMRERYRRRAIPAQSSLHNVVAKTMAVDFLTRFSYQILDRRIENIEKEHYETHDDAPAHSRFVGDESHRDLPPEALHRASHVK